MDQRTNKKINAGFRGLGYPPEYRKKFLILQSLNIHIHW